MHLPSSSHLRGCAHCGQRAVVRPSALWRLAIVPAWATLAVMVFGAGLVGPLIMFLVPPLLVGGISLLSVVHARASAPAECSACGKIAAPRPEAHGSSVPPAAVGGSGGLHTARAA